MATNRRMPSLSAVSASEAAIRACSAGLSSSRRPMKFIRTRSACSSATSRSISSVNSSIRSSTSASGRVQFSVENENTVRSFTPASEAARTTFFSARAPARWPAPTGRCRSFAHRPLPSMMIAMDSGISVGPAGGSVRGAHPSPSTARAVRKRVSRVRAATSDFEDLGLFAAHQVVDGLDLGVGELLDLVLGPLQLVAREVAVLLRPLQVVEHVAADVADRDPALLGHLVHQAHHLLAPLL